MPTLSTQSSAERLRQDIQDELQRHHLAKTAHLQALSSDDYEFARAIYGKAHTDAAVGTRQRRAAVSSARVRARLDIVD